ncbi:MAG: UbiD family decarboxylase [Ardenticatenaceae bacterium]|nr:UbiD family decarboxylase [Ardenticatenaceae bacterium]HBY92669.1 phenylphosphate carboxylase subunit beta [Chloroflexota bacterium]
MPYQDLRHFLARLETEGQLARICKQVDWNQEIGHVAKLNEQKSGPALLFENVKDYPGQSVLTSLLTTKERVALALDIPPEASLLDISRAWVERIQGVRIPPKLLETAPCQENVVTGDAVNLYDMAAPWYYPKDGGRYIGTASFLLSRNLETGRINLGTYRVMIIDEKTAGIQIIKAKDAEIDLRGYAAAGKSMPVALVIGADPVLFLVSSTLFPLTDGEYDVAGALRGEPIEVVGATTVDLPIPATAEVIIEGEITPGETLPEGPFGEYTGYYSGKGVVQREFIKVKAITYRNNPIHWGTTVGKPVTDTHMVMGINRTASLWNDLKRMKIPGIKAVFSPPASAGRFLVIISVEQMYPAHAMQVGLAAFASVTGNYGLKTVIVVDHDIDPENMDQVMYALSFRYQPARGTQIISRGRSTPLDPSLEIANRDVTSRVVIDATIPWEWKEKPIPIELDPAMEKQIRDNWNEYFPNGSGW